MNFSGLENYLFIPDKFRIFEGTLFKLGKPGSFAPNSFVILPYQNPQVKETVPVFYNITDKIEIGENSLKADLSTPPQIKLQPITSKENYIQKVTSLKTHIQRGNIYEIN